MEQCKQKVSKLLPQEPKEPTSNLRENAKVPIASCMTSGLEPAASWHGSQQQTRMLAAARPVEMVIKLALGFNQGLGIKV